MPKYLVTYQHVSYSVGAKSVGYSLGSTIQELEKLPENDEELAKLAGRLFASDGWSHSVIIGITPMS